MDTPRQVPDLDDLQGSASLTAQPFASQGSGEIAHGAPPCSEESGSGWLRSYPPPWFAKIPTFSECHFDTVTTAGRFHINGYLSRSITIGGESKFRFGCCIVVAFVLAWDLAQLAPAH